MLITFAGPFLLLLAGAVGAGLIRSGAPGVAIEPAASLTQPRGRAMPVAESVAHRTGLLAALFLVFMALWNIATTLSEGGSAMPPLYLHATILGVLTFGYGRGSVACAVGLLAYPTAVIISAAVFAMRPEAPAKLTSLLVATLPARTLIDPILGWPQQAADYSRGVASYSALLIPVAFLLVRAIREMLQRSRPSWLPIAGVGIPTALYLGAVAAGAFGPEVYAHSRQWLSRPMNWVRGQMTLPDAQAALAEPNGPDWREACEAADKHTELPVAMTRALVRAAASPDEMTRIACFSAIGRLGPAGQAAIPRLAGAISDRSKLVRRAAIRSLVAVGVRTHAATLRVTFLSFAQDVDPEVRRTALEAVSVATKAIASTHADALTDPVGNNRYKAALALWQMGSEAAPATLALAAALSDGEARVRQQAATALRAIGADARAAVPALTAAAKQDPSPQVRAAALGALFRVSVASPDLAVMLSERASDPHSGVTLILMELAALGPPAAWAVPALIPLLSDQPTAVRLLVLRTLGSIGPAAKAAVPRIMEMRAEEPVDDAQAPQLAAAIETALKRIQPGI